MYESKDILEAACVIRLYLSDLLGSDAESVDQALANLLTKSSSSERVDNQILELLAENDATREWTRKFLSNKIPPPVTRSYNSLAGSQSVVDANTFVCQVPGCPTVWYRPKAGIEPPECKDHKISLVSAQFQSK